MARKKPRAEQIVAILRQIEVEVANHQPTGQACREAGITAPTYYRWRKEYGGLKLEQARRMITNVIFIFSSYVDYAGPAGILGGFRIKVSVGIAVLLASGLLTAQTAEKPKVYVDQTDKF